MAADDRISLLAKAAQNRLFRLAERDCGLHLKTISLDSGIPYSNLRGYASGDTIMPITAMMKLAGVVPDELLSHLMRPVGRCVVAEKEDDSPESCLSRIAIIARSAA